MGKEVINNSTIQLIRRQLREKALAYAARMDNDAAVQRAVDEVMEDMRRSGPQQDRLQETLDAIWEKQQGEGDALDPPALSGNEDEQRKRLEYAEQCRKALFQALKASAMRSLVFQDTVKSYFKPGELKGEVSDHGWMQDLLWLTAPGDSQKDAQWNRHRNEIVVLAAAMSENAIEPQLFADRYRKWLIEDKGEEKARATFGDALNNAPDALRKAFFDAVGVKNYYALDVQSTYERFQRGELRGGREKVDEAYAALLKYAAVGALYHGLDLMSSMSDINKANAKDAVSKLIGGNVSAEELEKVYSRAIGQDGSFQVAQNYSYALNDLMEMGYEIRQDIITEGYPENEEREAAAAYFETAAARCANPYYALMTGEDLKQGKIKSFAFQDNGRKETSYLDSYAKDQLRAEENETAMVAAREAQRLLGQIRQYGTKPVPLPCEDNEDLLMYRGNGRTLIFHTEEVTLANGTVTTRYTSLCREPGLFIDRGLTRGVAELLQTSSELPQPLPWDAELMNTALDALNGVTLGSEATPDSVKNLMRKLNEMKEAAEDYYAEHEKEWDDAALKGKNRKNAEARLGFAGELITFAEKKIYLLSGIQEYMKELEDLGLCRWQPEAALNEERVSAVDEENSADGEEEKAEQKENRNEYKDKLALINEDKSIDQEEAGSVSTEMKELLQNARGNVEREQWAQGERTVGMDSKANKHLDFRIEANMGIYRSMELQCNAEKALVASTLKYMMNQENWGKLLGFALEHAGFDAMEDMIMGSDSFQNRLEQLDLSDTKQVEDCLKNQELFTKPLGDKLLHMVEKVLEEEAPLVEKQDRVNMLKVAEDNTARDLKKSEEAMENGDAEDAAHYGAEALAHQTAASLLKLTAGKARDPYALQKMVHSSDIFKAELRKLDLSKPGAVKAALDAKFGSAVAGSIMRHSQKTGDDLGSDRKSLTGKGVQTEPTVQNGVIPQNGI